MNNSNTISVVAEINEDLYDAMQDYLDKHPYWDLSEAFNASLSLFMLQNWRSSQKMKPKNYCVCSQTYLNSVLSEDILYHKYSAPNL